jgi:hypothetical protein
LDLAGLWGGKFGVHACPDRSDEAVQFDFQSTPTLAGLGHFGRLCFGSVVGFEHGLDGGVDVGGIGKSSEPVVDDCVDALFAYSVGGWVSGN